MSKQERPYALIADIGGTNARFALIDSQGTIITSHTLAVQDFTSIEVAITAFLERNDFTQPSVFAIAVACPVYRDWIALTNSHWQFSQQELRQLFNLEQLLVLNDFSALAWAVPTISRNDLISIGGGDATTGNIAVVGPGTGLGVSALIQQSTGYFVVEGEGGHVSFAPGNDLEISVLQHIDQRFPRVSSERLLQGSGLVLLYQTLCAIEDKKTNFNQPSEITNAGVSGECLVCKNTLSMYCEILGSFAGDLALTVGARGGVYLGGGVVSHFREFLLHSGFRARFEDKGRFDGFMQSIPVYLITAHIPAFQGITRALMSR